MHLEEFDKPHTDEFLSQVEASLKVFLFTNESVDDLKRIDLADGDMFRRRGPGLSLKGKRTTQRGRNGLGTRASKG